MKKQQKRNILARKRIRTLTAQIGGLGMPSKMPGFSWGIPATACKTGSKLRKVPGSICSMCYAAKGNYLYPRVQAAQETRLRAYAENPVIWLCNMLDIFDALETYVPENERYFRWFDSGDLQSAQHLSHIMHIARLNPTWKFWVATREKSMVAKAEDLPSNLVVRLSMPMVGQTPNTEGTTSTVDSGTGHACPARTQNNECGTCRACWDSNVRNVDYAKH